MRWHIECFDYYAMRWRRINTARVHEMGGEPIPRTFKTRAAAMEWAYDEGYAGGRNSRTRYVKE